MSQQLAAIGQTIPADVQGMSEADLLNEWNKDKPVFPKMNVIKVDNKKFIDQEDASEEPKLNPNFGKVFAYRYEGEGENQKEVITEIKIGTPLFVAKDMVFAMCKDRDEENKPMFTCDEVESGQDLVVHGQDGQVVFEGPYQEAKSQFNLKYQVSAYIFLEGHLYRWRIGGANLGTWFKVGNLLNKEKFPRYIKIESIKPMLKNNIYWNVLGFGIGERVDIKLAVSLRRALEQNLGQLKKEEKEAVESTGEGSS